MRLAGLTCFLAAWIATGCTLPAGAGDQPEITSARYETSLDSYPHRIMGSIREKAELIAVDANGAEYRIDLRDQSPGTHVFEDMAPRVIDATGDGRNDIVVVESDPSLGAQLAIYDIRNGALTKTAATPHIGQRFRWLAPAGIADLNGDASIEITYIDRPHLAKTLRIWRYEGGKLREVAALPGYTNHRIGEEDIAGGIRDCDNGPEMILATGNWDALVALRWNGAEFARQTLGADTSRAAFAAAMACR